MEAVAKAAVARAVATVTATVTATATATATATVTAGAAARIDPVSVMTARGHLQTKIGSLNYVRSRRLSGRNQRRSGPANFDVWYPGKSGGVDPPFGMPESSQRQTCVHSCAGI